MLDAYRKIFDLLTERERKRFYVLIVMVLVMGVFEAVGLASILPFLAVLSDPQMIETNRYLALAYERLGFDTHRGFLIAIGCAVFFVVVAGLVFKSATIFLLIRFSTRRAYSLSSRLLHGYLNQPYTFFLNRHSADLGKSVLSEVDRVVSGALVPAAKLLAQSVVVVSLVVVLIVAQPVVAPAVALVLGGSYALIFYATRSYLTRIGEERVVANRDRYKIAQEAMGGIKDVKVSALEGAYAGRFRRPAERHADCQASSQIIKEVPRYVLEAIAFGGMLLMVLVLLSMGEGGLSEILPTLGLFAFAGSRLFPALQQVYRDMSALRFGIPALDAIHDDLTKVHRGRDRSLDGAGPAAPLHLSDRLELRHVDFTYPEAERTAVRDLDLTIRANTTVGLVGGTGAGKTTVVDLILGLLQPVRGELLVDGKTVTADNLRAWQASIGYVPQQIFLSDDTVSANIAFGVRPDRVDQDAVERAARIAELHDFVVSEMPQGYDTYLGERGVRLSGGQRQRIGIARALYRDPDVLILDEATSALDNLTEKAVMAAVHNLGRRKTVILIAHRLTTVESCDRIFMLEKGRLAACGTYDELLQASAEFRSLAHGAA
jgi:ABC-type multidrug transport system fused ATPase/permease subunit